MVIQSKIDTLVKLGDWLKQRDETIVQHAIRAASFENPWFTPENVHAALDAICDSYLDRNQLQNFIKDYPKAGNAEVKSVGIIMAGNIPMVGFHDMLCVYLSGHRGLLKLSDRDRVMMTLILNKLMELDPRSNGLESVSSLRHFDAVIATGGNTSAATFRSYFSRYPHVIRSNRNAVAILSDNESELDLEALGRDVFHYFGLGCRSVSKLYVPLGYDFEKLLEAFKKYESVQLHSKYKNNYDYNFATLEINRIPYMTNGSLLLREDPSLASRIATLHFEFYHSQVKLLAELRNRMHEIQCIVGRSVDQLTNIVPFGFSQKPQLDQFADGCDTMKFLCEL